MYTYLNTLDKVRQFWDSLCNNVQTKKKQYLTKIKPQYGLVYLLHQMFQEDVKNKTN
jgi:hypothetical protein